MYDFYGAIGKSNKEATFTKPCLYEVSCTLRFRLNTWLLLNGVGIYTTVKRLARKIHMYIYLHTSHIERVISKSSYYREIWGHCEITVNTHTCYFRIPMDFRCITEGAVTMNLSNISHRFIWWGSMLAVETKMKGGFKAVPHSKLYFIYIPYKH